MHFDRGTDHGLSDFVHLQGRESIVVHTGHMTAVLRV
jgi:hypothetical protein